MTSTAPVILIVEDEASLLELLRYNLEKEGYVVLEATNGSEALKVVEERALDLMILDWMIPVLSGLEVCRAVRQDPKTQLLPILMLTARSDEDDRVKGLDTGADDYVTKPFSMPELSARIKALLRRAKPQATKGVLTYEDLVMDLDSHRVTRGDSPVHLGPTEYRLLQFLLQSPGKVFSREELLNAVWGSDIYVEPRTVDVHILRLRKALGRNVEARRGDMIRTVRAAGYSLDARPNGDDS